MDIMFPEGNLAGTEAIAAIQAMVDTPIPIIFISARDDMIARLQAVRAGGAAYFTKPLDINLLIKKLDLITARHIPDPYRILIIEDEPVLAAYYELTLQQANMLTRVITDPLQVMQPLIEFRPDLILMDIYMPQCNGLELARVIRQQEAYVSIPIVFLSSETNQAKQMAAMDLGGDDFLTKPVQPTYLVSSVIARAQRSRILSTFVFRDSLTGLLNHTRIKEHIEIEVARARRQYTSMVFAMIDIDHFKQVNDLYGHPTGDRVLKSLAQVLNKRLRRTDIIGRYGGEEFALILPNTDGPSALHVLDEIRQSFSRIRQQCYGAEFSVTFSCGIATFPQYNDVTALSDAADQALYQAKHAGRDRVILSRKIE